MPASGLWTKRWSSAGARAPLSSDVYDATAGETPMNWKSADRRPESDEVPVFACGASGRIAPWGELLSTAAQVRGAEGHGDGRPYARRARNPCDEIPVFAGGRRPLDSKGRGKVAAIDVPVVVAGARVAPGDLVFGDADGVVWCAARGWRIRSSPRTCQVAGENATREAWHAAKNWRCFSGTASC